MARKRGWLCFICAFWAGAASAVAAELDPARQLFQDGVQQMQAGGCKDSPVADPLLCELAIERFTAAFDLNPAALGALKNRARVEESLGRWCAAAATLKKLASLAILDADPAKRLWGDFADAEYQRLDARIPRLILEVLPAQGDSESYHLRINGEGVPREFVGRPRQLDPGEHEVSVMRASEPMLSQRIELRPSETLRVVLAVGNAEATLSPALSAPAPQERPFWNEPTWPISVAALGGTSLAVGLGFGYSALQERRRGCDSVSRQCDAQSLREARSHAQLSTLFAVGGSVLLASGLTWHLWQSQRHEASQDSLALHLLPSVGGAEVALVGNLW